MNKVFATQYMGDGRTLELGWDGHLYTVTETTKKSSRVIGSFIYFSEANIEFFEYFKENYEEDISHDYKEA